MHLKRLVYIVSMAFALMIPWSEAQDCYPCTDDIDSYVNQRLLRLEKELRTVVRHLEGLVDLETEIKDLRESDSLQEKLIENLMNHVNIKDKSKSDNQSGSVFSKPEDDSQGNPEGMTPINEQVTRVVLENISRVFLDNHLQEIHGKVDLDVYQDEMRKMDGKLQKLDTTLQDISKKVLSTDQDLKAMQNSMNDLSSTFEKNITHRLNILEENAVSEKKFEALESKVWHLSTTRELLEDQLAVVLNKNSDLEEDSCQPPVSQDPHLSVAVNTDPSGKKTLRFACQPIGRYALSSSPTLVTCINGTWTGSHPTCNRLLNEDEISNISEEMKDENPCNGQTGDFPDPSNCRRFFNCWNERTTLLDCPSDLYFNTHSKKCEDHASCSPTDNSKVKQLKDMIPPVLLDYEVLIAVNDRKEVANPGQLLVNSGKNFTLLCLFPDTVWGAPSWNVHYVQPYLLPPPAKSERLQNGIQLSLFSAREEHSGIYTCRTPFGKEHSLLILVQDPAKRSKWKCQALYTRHIPDLVLEKDDEQQTITFKCRGGLRLVGNSFTRCREDGVWSHGSLPRCKP